MKYIIKGQSPAKFDRWKEQENDNWKPTWDNLRNPEKGILKEALLNDQGHICCYCGIRVNNDHNTEIEHVKPRFECVEEEKLDYNNLIVSCIGGRKDPLPKELSCNAKRGNDQLKMSPLNPDCENRFLYTLDGQILTKDEEDGDCLDTIRVLGLDIERLKNIRKSKLLYYRNINKSQAQELVNAFSEKNRRGKK